MKDIRDEENRAAREALAQAHERAKDFYIEPLSKEERKKLLLMRLQENPDYLADLQKISADPSDKP